MGLAEMAMRYVLGLKGVTCALAGVDSVAQMRINVAIFGKGPLPANLMNAIDQLVPDLPERILNPSTWSMRMPDVKPEGKLP